jgi:CheY-like chemotaxis protein
MPRKRIVLYADDDIDDKMWISEACKTVNESLELHFVENGRQVLQYLHSNELPSLIVLDLNMPDLDGRQTLKAIKNHVEYQHLPVAVVTTSSSRLDREVCIRLGAAIFLTKPDTYSEWQQIVRRLELLLTTPINF